MQVEYESSPPSQSQTQSHSHSHVQPIHSEGYDESMLEEGSSFRPGLGQVDPDEDDDEGPGEGEPQEGGESSNKPEQPATTARKITKQRQSLAEKQLGTTIFPVSRIKKIIKADKELDNMSSEAVFMISVATEYFIKHFMEEGYTKARLEKRKIVNYKDMAAVVARSEEFDFLKDVIPQPMSLSEALERRKQKISTDENPSYDDEINPNQNSTLLNDEDLPPLVNSTNPLFPNAIMKKPPNTHAKTAMPKPAPLSEVDLEGGNDDDVENQQHGEIAPQDVVLGLGEGQSPTAQITSKAPTSSKAKKGSNPNAKEKEKAKEKDIPREYTSPKIFTGKNAPSTPHGLTTRGAARRSLAGTDVDMSPVNAIRSEVQEDQSPVAVVVGAAGVGEEGGSNDVDERMEE
ncbi:uncharacterized protein I303_107415 [Kwoniella dejecticola CBS 10117]|uniref:DNA polymerase epsilon p12 subunit n=1 Tax=Kwoniella dejecticola CBS 10117 TaxID=1296121 RepID=A0A1A5ZZL9_9TREE|nr:DNA polymerase epsilon p12 subunit [Kwoniella dejecticola CBS 10117]OBR83256.1 DNA polymerase epsilon p12 subunit [Kwoniella dejecticola CBS 10117]